jgi:hypothetical protein
MLPLGEEITMLELFGGDRQLVRPHRAVAVGSCGMTTFPEDPSTPNNLGVISEELENVRWARGWEPEVATALMAAWRLSKGQDAGT